MKKSVRRSKFYFLIVEVKNIAGTLLFDNHFNQMIRILDNKEEGFPDPLLQVKHQEMQLKDWLKSYKYPPIPVESIVVISNPSTIIKSTNSYLQNIIHSAKLPSKIRELNHKFNNEIINEKELSEIISQIIKAENTIKSSYELMLSSVRERC